MTIAQINPDVLRELTLSRDQLARAEGAVDQASRHVESARAAHRRAVEDRDQLRQVVARLEAELHHGPDRHPLIAAIEANGRNGHGNGNGARRPDPPADAGTPDTPPAPRSQRRPLASQYDRDVAAGLEAAEARRAAASNGHPIDRHLERVAAIAEPEALHWREIPIEHVTAPLGHAGELIATTLRGAHDIETAGDLADTLRDYEFEAFDLAGSEPRALREAIQIFRQDQGWDDSTTWPDGIPAAWIADDDEEAPVIAPRPAPTPTPEKPRRREERRPGETVREARARRKAEREAAAKKLRGPEVAREGIAAIDAARQDLAERRAGKVVPREVIEPPVYREGEPDGPWPEEPPADACAVVEETPDGGAVADNDLAVDEIRACNRCNAVRSPAVGACPACGSPEYRIERRAGRPDWAPPAGAAVVRPYDLATIREAIEEVEGPAGDGSKTRICSKCRQGYDFAGASCPACGWRISRAASECLANLSNDRPVMIATGGHGDDQYCFVIHGRPWDADSIRQAVATVEGPDGDGTKSGVCSECATVYPRHMAKCPRCGGAVRRTTIGESLAEATRPEPEPSTPKRRKRSRARKEAPRAHA